MDLRMLSVLCALALSAAPLVDSYHILCVLPIPSRSHNLLGKGIVSALLKGGHEFSANISATAASIPALKEALVKGRFDAVVTETFFSDPSVEALVDEVRSVSIIPLLFNDFNMPMSFFERLANVGLYNIITAARNVPLPPLEAALHNVSILFVNSHPSFAAAQSMPPNSSALPAATKQALLKTFGELPYTVLWKFEEELKAAARNVPLPPLEAALHNVSILFVNSHPSFAAAQSMPPNSSALPAATKQALLKTFGELPYTVLWKFEEELKGLLSNLETLRYGVPLVSIPVFGDQPANAARAVRAGYAAK
ncbi:UDP-glycosyltransferase UGT41A2, partial [Operophtera brumata]